MVLAFKPQFKAPILAGTKIHTTRLDPNRRWKSGVTAHMATGVRTKNYDCFKKDVCTGTQHVFMTYSHSDLIQISIDGRELFSYHERLEFAKNDGFETWQSFIDWFFPIIINSEDESYSGRIIHWTDKRY